MTRMDAAAALTRWHAVVESRDPVGLPGLIAEDAVFRSPAVHTPQVGRDTVVGYLTAAFTVLGPALTYEREWLGVDSGAPVPHGGGRPVGVRHRHDHLGQERADTSTSP